METQQQEQESQVIDFGFDATEADALRPILQGGTFDAEVAFVREEKTKNTNLRQLAMGFRLTQPVKQIDGKTVNPGFVVFHRLLVEPTGNLTAKMIEDRLKRYQVIIGGPGRVNTGTWVGKPLRIKVTVREPRDDEKTGQHYEASNEVGGVFFASKKA